MNKVLLAITISVLLLFLFACQHESAPDATNVRPQTSATTPTEKPFQLETIQNGMTLEDISAAIGFNGQLLHSNVYVHKWEIKNWKTVYMWFYSPSQSDPTDPWEAGDDWILGGMSTVDDCKNYPGDYKVTTEDMQKTHEGMSFEEVIAILGYGAENAGSGFAALQWPMVDGNYLRVQFMDKVTDITIEEKPYSDHDSYVGDVNRIHVGMTYQEVRQTLTGTNILACKHAEL